MDHLLSEYGRLSGAIALKRRYADRCEDPWVREIMEIDLEELSLIRDAMGVLCRGDLPEILQNVRKRRVIEAILFIDEWPGGGVAKDLRLSGLPDIRHLLQARGELVALIDRYRRERTDEEAG